MRGGPAGGHTGPAAGRTGPAGHTGPAMQTPRPQRDGYGFTLGLVAILEALTFLTASMLHLGTHIPVLNITGEKFPGAVIPEALIGFVMLAGAIVILAAPRRAWGIALGTHVFAAAGTVVGILEVHRGGQHHPGADSIYHYTIEAVLLVMIAVLARRRSRAALRQAATKGASVSATPTSPPPGPKPSP